MKKTIWVRVYKDNRGKWKIFEDNHRRIICLENAKQAIGYSAIFNGRIEDKIYSYRKATVEL